VSDTRRTAATNPGDVLRRALLLWGLGDLALGRTGAGAAWLIAELVGAATVAWLSIGYATTTWYAIPYLAGSLFLIAWGAQAVAAYGRARRAADSAGSAPARSPAAVVVWLSIPILAWGTGFWLVAASAATPSAVLDRFESAWPALASGTASVERGLAADPAALETEAGIALAALQQACDAGRINSDCGSSPENLLRDVRISIVHEDGATATAVVEIVSFERRSSRFLGIFSGTDLVPVPQQTLLRLDLSSVPAALPGGLELGAGRWQIVNATHA
jgi:hypothetical protein